MNIDQLPSLIQRQRKPVVIKLKYLLPIHDDQIDRGAYYVLGTTNSLYPSPGTFLTTEEVQKFIDAKHVKVNIVAGS